MTYWSHFQHEDGDEDLCAQFENTLRPEIRAVVNVFQLTNLPTLVKTRPKTSKVLEGAYSSASQSQASRTMSRERKQQWFHPFKRANQMFLLRKTSHCEELPTTTVNIGAKLNVQDEVFAMNELEASKSDDLIRGKCIIKYRLLAILFNFGATHSFISVNCVGCLGLPVSLLPYDLTVSTPIAKPVVTSSVCLSCSVMVHGSDFSIDLICLSFSQLDVILRMNWLSSNHILLDYKEKALIFGAGILENYVNQLQDVTQATDTKVTADLGDRYLGSDDDLDSEDLAKIKSWHENE
ncbi:uncharacterized protein LOC113850757 [Abrus precatorius]|uniref:Uncharacterized protein LOC113850757 n=1 Tax=Abrus precatorius TaxID=3816 RepID=A0A8B8K0W5_ABRPR|nr:uncharacterized protein LOC113850757 [Abrus precatorius]